MNKVLIFTKIKNYLRKRKGLLHVIKTYKAQGFIESFIELFFLIMERLKINLGKFIISHQTIYLYSESKHLNWLERILIHRNNKDQNNSVRKNKRKMNYLAFETI